LGLEAQRATVAGFLNGGLWRLVGEFIEVESGRSPKRRELDKALVRCRVMGATLIVANVSRLTRSVAFLSRLLEQEVDVRFCDLPQIEGPTGKFILQQMAAVAELEAGLISDRTRKALAAAKARGVKLGGPGNLKRQDLGAANGRAARTQAAKRRAADLANDLCEIRAREVRRFVRSPQG
jgi:DNA invertase Pin-like site-specific DNA recombinase